MVEYIDYYVKKRGFRVNVQVYSSDVSTTRYNADDTRITRNGDVRITRNGDTRVARNITTGVYPTKAYAKKRSFRVNAKVQNG